MVFVKKCGQTGLLGLCGAILHVITWYNIARDHMIQHFTWSHDTTFHVITWHNISRDHMTQHCMWSHDTTFHVITWYNISRDHMIFQSDHNAKLVYNCEFFILCQSKLVLFDLFFLLGNGAYVIFFNVITTNLLWHYSLKFGSQIKTSFISHKHHC